VDAPAAAAPAARLPPIDAARGVAIAAMVVYHFSWDLRYVGYIAADVTEDFGWRLFARIIAGSFLFIVGVSLVLASRNGFNRARYLRRLGVVAAAAAAITAVTFVIFRDNFIFFGILHHIAVASVLGLAFVTAPIAVTIACSVACFLAPSLLAGPAFDSPAVAWLGLASYLPRTNDFVPIFPWFGVVLLGIAAARLVRLIWPDGVPLGGLGGAVPWPLAWAGRHSLVIYLLHQPMLFGLVLLAAQLAPPDFRGFEPSYVESCTSACVESEVEEDICRRTCSCVAQRMQSEGLWGDLMQQTLSQAQEQRYFTLSDQCRLEAGR
jgi:uncharacterized membrane protein